jgi:FtsZ-binding cell division protein ZapB
MEAKEIDFTKLNEAVKEFGSLQKANSQLKKDKLVLEKENAHLKQENKSWYRLEISWSVS